MTPTDIPELVRRLRDYQPTLTEGMIIHSRETVEQAAEILWAMAADLAMTTTHKDAELDQSKAANMAMARALDKIAQSHLGDQPATSPDSEIAYAMRHIGHIRGIAAEALAAWDAKP